ncbi:MAG: M20/M25/M40 family metallo-hydrolase [Thermaerobacter sp.]|nr:M20/M25/M40 family metallo-hydrolase [Thermaerobacter sp.]
MRGGDELTPGSDLRFEERIDSHEIRQKLARLVSRQSVVEDGFTESAVVAEVSEWCVADGFSPVLTEVAPGRPNLVVNFRGSKPGPTLLLEAHADTVTAGDLSAWTRPAFQLTQEGDRLYGRGTADTKGNLVAAYLGVRAVVAATRGNFPGTIRFLVAIDEEDMMTGIRHFIAAGGASDVDGAICCEPEDAQVCISHKGALRVRVEFYGKMAHGAMPLTGNNPLTPMARFLLTMQEEERAEQQAVGFDRYLGWPSITPTQITSPIQGPSGFNVIPGSASVSLDIRTVPGQSHPDLVRRLQTRLDAVIGQANADLTTGQIRHLRNYLEESVEAGLYAAKLVLVDDRPVTNTPISHPLVQCVADAIKRSTGRPVVYAGVPGATDGTWLWAQGIPVVTTGAGNRFIPHQVDEWVSLRQLVEMSAIYARSAYGFLSAGKKV